MKISRGAAYAVYGLRYLANRGLNQKVTISEISNSFGLPEKHLAKIFQGLAKTKFVNSVRGINGGFMLSTPPDQITLLDIVEAVEGPFDVDNCMIRYGHCSYQDSCQVCDLLQQTHREIMDVLRKVKLTDLLLNAEQEDKCRMSWEETVKEFKADTFSQSKPTVASSDNSSE